MNRRQFLGTTAAALAAGPLAVPAAAESGAPAQPAASQKPLPIGVFTPPFQHLNVDQLLDKCSSLGIEAVEIPAGGPNGSAHCPRTELLADKAKARAWK
jgi:hypothetical protein